ncbi:Helix-turn-helix domain of resolvase [Cardiobacterium valvarum F0432]|uniref:Helix-turn-helix domain of resolvase n=1 Tax=Cardiobacterium valvarum F0432 TaxID=797473 RepID=G9ZG51_9GAMM|nr:Helix-turn-helix domain of resolvase [Cardiobacterium valvarum F0432]
MTDLIQLVGQLEARKIHLRSLSEDLDTTSSTGKLIFHIFGAIAEFERNLIRERTMAGLAAARKRGRLGGRPTKLDEQRIKEIRILLNDPDMAVNDIAKRYGVSRGTIYRVLRQF